MRAVLVCLLLVGCTRGAGDAHDMTSSEDLAMPDLRVPGDFDLAAPRDLAGPDGAVDLGADQAIAGADLEPTRDLADPIDQGPPPDLKPFAPCLFGAGSAATSCGSDSQCCTSSPGHCTSSLCCIPADVQCSGSAAACCSGLTCSKQVGAFTYCQ